MREQRDLLRLIGLLDELEAYATERKIREFRRVWREALRLALGRLDLVRSRGVR